MRILIVGGGMGGTILANNLARRLAPELRSGKARIVALVSLVSGPPIVAASSASTRAPYSGCVAKKYNNQALRLVVVS